ncbi:vWA domain-containing protein [Alloprevotella tannerae]|uniref:vWA domain-containing protein n=1 Tax=Alloprevotella tannerae TaxID=76122 RepID=UPI00241C5F10|nr:VWA domain-containing protein [Alloprevotella tannerae]
MTFAQPYYFLLFLLLIPLILWHFLLKGKRESTLTLSTTDPYRQLPRTPRTALIHLPFLLRILTFACIIFALARPQTHNALSSKETEGINIMMVIDVSTSMLTPDLPPSRIETAKQVAYEFINNRPDDNIGLTVFGGEAYTQCPLTTDHSALLNMFKQVNCDLQKEGVISPGTAIGMGLSSAVSHLEQSKSKSKVIILLTDGENNAGEISPLTAAEMAKRLGIRIYTISVGTDAAVNQPVATLPNGETYEAAIKQNTDPKTLEAIANSTGGKFYQARSKAKLRNIYQNIDRLEKTKLKVSNYNRHYEAYQLFALVALFTFALEILLRLTWFRRIP